MHTDPPWREPKGCRQIGNMIRRRDRMVLGICVHAKVYASWTLGRAETFTVGGVRIGASVLIANSDATIAPNIAGTEVLNTRSVRRCGQNIIWKCLCNGR